MAEIPAGNLPLRVNQLDAASYDDYIYDMLWERVQDILKYFKGSTILSTYAHELKAVIKLSLWLVVFRRQHASLGQQLLDMRYAVTNSGKAMEMISSVQSHLYLICHVILPYIMSKLDDWFGRRDASTSFPMLSKLYVILSGIWHCVSLVHFVTFLRKGTFLHVYERLCGIQAIHPEGRQLRQVGFEVFNRELIWHDLAKFMLFLLPYINMRKLRKWFSSGSQTSSDHHKFCMLCDSFPTNPQQISGCVHIYCYHCVAVLIATEGYWHCVSCGSRIDSIDLLLPAVHRVASAS
ncbi:peroxisome biogenesis factor 2-like isoform X1 [Watersipora subatra]|uniref:peroxisome biogenesis factor 2-like isoform X1 n=1 Tax=Watersipora subatra TaxID=2589382 RepID=UPI00355C562E